MSVTITFIHINFTSFTKVVVEAQILKKKKIILIFKIVRLTIGAAIHV